MTILRSAALFGLAAAAALLLPRALVAQEATLPAPAAFNEFFTGAAGGLFGARTQSAGAGVGRIIVGLSLGRAPRSQKIDLAAIRVAAPNDGGARLCVTLSTADGRYSAKSEHAITGAFAAPPRLGLKTEYGRQLSDYDASELLVFASRAKSCTADAGGSAGPAIAAKDATELIVAINIGRGRPKAWLEKEGAPATKKARCGRDEHAAKTHDCAISVGTLSGGDYEIVVDAGRLDGPSLIERTRLVLP